VVRWGGPTQKPAPPLQGWKLPPLTHKYRLLEQAPHRVYKGGREWRVDASRFAISKTITGVVLDLDAGALRELHWHPNADERQYVLDGRVSQPAELFAKFPHSDVFIAGKDGPGK
jgi:oxalate decarboxylase